MNAIGSALGSAGFHCFDDSFDLLLAAHGSARFLSVESCGQCTPCKDDGLAITALLGGLIDGSAPDDATTEIASRLDTVTNAARCNLAAQQQVVVGSLLSRRGASAPTAQLPIPQDVVDEARARVLVPLVDIVDGAAVYDGREARKKPDWSFDDLDSGTYPAQRLQDVPVDETLDDAPPAGEAA
jgi:hypothetical protein